MTPVPAAWLPPDGPGGRTDQMGRGQFGIVPVSPST